MRLSIHEDLPPPGQLAHGDFEMVVRRLADDLAFGTDASLFVGAGLEYAQSRLYQSGDSIRQMDWRLTARTGKPFVKEYEALKRTDVYLVVDTSASMAISSRRLSKHDVAIWIAAAVGLVAQRRLSPVALVGGGERTTRFVPSLLASDLWRALEPLRVSDCAEGTALGERLARLGPRARRRSVILALTDLHDPSAPKQLRQLAQRHDVVVIQIEDSAELGVLRSGFFRGEEAETGSRFISSSRAHLADRSGLPRDLVRGGVAHLRLRTDEPVLPPLRRFLGDRGGLGGGRA